MKGETTMKCKTLRKNLKLEIIEKWLKDSDCDVRQAAMNALGDRKIITRTIEPPEKYIRNVITMLLLLHTSPMMHIFGVLSGKNAGQVKQ